MQQMKKPVHAPAVVEPPGSHLSSPAVVAAAVAEVPVAEEAPPMDVAPVEAGPVVDPAPELSPDPEVVPDTVVGPAVQMDLFEVPHSPKQAALNSLNHLRQRALLI